MGLDMYAYARKDGQTSKDNEEIHYWRKHNRLHGWMEELWKTKKANISLEDKFIERIDTPPNDGDFNCVELELNEHDLDALESDILDKNLPETGGFFFGSDSYEHDDTEKDDLEFIQKAREKLAQGYNVYYNSWW